MFFLGKTNEPAHYICLELLLPDFSSSWPTKVQLIIKVQENKDQQCQDSQCTTEVSEIPHLYFSLQVFYISLFKEAHLLLKQQQSQTAHLL